MDKKILMLEDINLKTYDGATAHFLGIYYGLKKLNISPIVLLPNPYPKDKVNNRDFIFYPSFGDYSKILSKFRYLVSILYFIKAIVKNKIKIIYCRYTPLFTFHLIISKIMKRKIILEINNTLTDFKIRRNFKNFIYQIIKGLYYISTKIAQRLIVVSSGMRKDLIKLKVEKNKIYLIPNGTNPEIFKPIKNDKINSYFYIGLISKIDNYHDFEKIIEVSELLRDYEDIKFLIVGKLENKKIIDLIKNKNLSDKFIFLGEIPYNKTPIYINQFDIALISTPKNLCGYTSPIKLFDYAGCGKIILCDKELIKKERSLRTFPLLTYNSKEDLKNKILAIKNNYKYYLKNYGEKARIAVLKRYNWIKICEKSLKGFYKKDLPIVKKERPIVLQVISNLSGGGAQSLLLNFLKEKGAKKFEYSIFTFEKKYSLKTFISLIKKIRKTKPKIIHAHLFPELYYTAFASFFYKKGKYVYTEHNIFNRRQKFKILYPLERFVYHQYDKIIACASIVKEKLISYIPSLKRKIVTIQNGFSLKEYEIKESKEKSDLIFIGRLEKQKGVDILLKALKLLKEEEIMPKTFIIGYGSEEEKLKDYCEKEKLTNVRFLSKREDALSFLKASKIFVLPSRWEGLPITILEAASLKKPIITTDVGGIKEVLDENEAIFVEKDNPISLSKAIKTLLFNEELQKELGERSFAKVSNHFSMKTFSNKLTNLYKELIKK
ncbi:MAG: glycosyltransferase [candidate division WOR-3 bacterium]|nr:glycosyltransferase [candidate division WOR-3 bacterium]MDW8113708.1 glycosyltransferase [candidate division WOR-3 bacterium]